MSGFGEFLNWRSQVEMDIQRGGVEIRLGKRDRDTHFDFVTSISENTTMLSVPSGEIGPPPMRLPEEAARALLNALQKYYGPPPDDYRARYEEARDSLTIERARVDRLLGAPIPVELESR